MAENPALRSGFSTTYVTKCMTARLRRSFGSCLQRLLTPRFEVLENLQPGFPQALFVVRGTRLGGGDIGTGLFQGAFGPVSALRQDRRERPVDQHCVQEVQRRQEDCRGYGSEQ